GFSRVPAAGVYVNVPGTLAVAFSCAAPKAVPYTMSAGFAQVMTGVPLSTLMETVLGAVLWLAVSAGVRSPFSAWLGLAFSFVPVAGVLPKLPAESAVALSWFRFRKVRYV